VPFENASSFVIPTKPVPASFKQGVGIQKALKTPVCLTGRLDSGGTGILPVITGWKPVPRE